MSKFRKKPVVIDAVLWDASAESLQGVLDLASDKSAIGYAGPRELKIKTLEGDMVASCGDWIIRGVNGELYPCKPAIFYKTYERVVENSAVGEE